MILDIELRKKIRQLDEAYANMTVNQIMSPIMKRYLTLEKRPKDFPPKRVDILYLLYLELKMPSLQDVDPDDEDLDPLHEKYFESIRKINNYESL
jgi:hypothetical protein